MTRRLRIEREAREELASAIGWYEEQRPGLGGELLDAIDEAVAKLLENPDISAPIPGCPPDLPARRVFVKRFPYAVVFMESGDDVQVIAVAHLRRRPGVLEVARHAMTKQGGSPWCRSLTTPSVPPRSSRHPEDLPEFDVSQVPRYRSDTCAPLTTPKGPGRGYSFVRGSPCRLNPR